MQTAGRTVERSRRHDRHHLARPDLVALRDQRAHRLVGGPQRRIARPRHLDGDHPAPRHGAREGHPARRGGEHPRTRPGGEVHPAVPAPVIGGGRLPSPQDRRPPLQRPATLPVRIRRGGSRSRRRGLCAGSCTYGGRGGPGSRPASHGVRWRSLRGQGPESAARRREQPGNQPRRQPCHQPRHPPRGGRRHVTGAVAAGRGTAPVRSDSHGTTVPRGAAPRGSWTGSVDYRPVVDSAVTRHPAGPVHFFWRSGSPGRLRTPRHLPLFGGGRAPRSLVARRVGASGATAILRSR